MAPRTFTIHTLGCKVNQHEGQGIRERLIGMGMREVDLDAGPDVAVINTCTVTARADRKCRQEVRRAVRANPEATVIVTGCSAVTDADAFREIPGVTHVLTKDQIGSLDAVLQGGPAVSGDVFDLCISSFEGHTRAFMKIQDGCNAFCSYCIVPLARGRVRSRDLAQIGEEAQRLVDHGHKEIVLTGIHLGLYGADLDGVKLVDAVRETLGVSGLERLRLSSIEATEVSDELLDLFDQDARLCPHFHLPLQSGDHDVLRAMNRRYTPVEFLGAVARIRARLARPAITTDVMIGFPGETDAQFANTLRICRSAAFSRMHVFPFSPRPGTPAADMTPRVADATVRERETRALELAREMALQYKQGFEGDVVRPLIEGRRDRKTGLLTGLTERYLSVRFAGPDALMNRIAPVRVIGSTPETLKGEWVEEDVA